MSATDSNVLGHAVCHYCKKPIYNKGRIWYHDHTENRRCSYPDTILARPAVPPNDAIIYYRIIKGCHEENIVSTVIS